MNIAWELANAPGADVLFTGGLPRKQSLSLQSSQAEASLDSYSFNGHDRRRPLQTWHRRGRPRPRRIRRLISELQQVHPGAIHLAVHAIPRLYAATDATGMPDGEYALGSQCVHKCLGRVRLASGSLAGSALTMDQALRNLVEVGLDLADAAHRVSTFPADYLGSTDRGLLESGACADLVLLDSQLRVV